MNANINQTPLDVKFFESFSMQKNTRISKGVTTTDFFGPIAYREQVVAMLKSSLGNREIKRGKVKEMFAKITSGKWDHAVASLKFYIDPRGKISLMGGHHRLEALLAAFDADPLFAGVDIVCTVSPNKDIAIYDNEAAVASMTDHFMMAQNSFLREKSEAAAGAALIVFVSRYLMGGIDLPSDQKITIGNKYQNEIRRAVSELRGADKATRKSLVPLHIISQIAGQQMVLTDFVLPVATMAVRPGTAAYLYHKAMHGFWPKATYKRITSDGETIPMDAFPKGKGEGYMGLLLHLANIASQGAEITKLSGYTSSPLKPAFSVWRRHLYRSIPGQDFLKCFGWTADMEKTKLDKVEAKRSNRRRAVDENQPSA